MLGYEQPRMKFHIPRNPLNIPLVIDRLGRNLDDEGFKFESITTHTSADQTLVKLTLYADPGFRLELGTPSQVRLKDHTDVELINALRASELEVSSHINEPHRYTVTVPLRPDDELLFVG